jgi:NAD dependent epimerase/dehydratase family enzyme
VTGDAIAQPPRGRVVLAGASGFIGSYLRRELEAEGYTVQAIGRSGPDARWGDTDGIRRLLEGADLVINLAGKSVNCRYTARNRAEIFRSRLETTRELARAIAACDAPPALWINSSTATIYRHADDRPMTESTGEIGEGFSVQVATSWEREFFEPELPATRRVALRMAIVLGDGSALKPLLMLARVGLGGPQLDGPWFATRARRRAGTFHRYAPTHGRQRFSWVHLDDVLGVIRFVRDHAEIEGPVNVSAPNPEDNRSLMAILRRVTHRPVGLPAFRWMLELGMFVFRTESELVLKSRWVLPERLTEAGYVFRHPRLEPAIRDIVRR